MAVRPARLGVEQEQQLALDMRTVREARENPETHEIEVHREEISEFLIDILNNKVNGVAVGFFGWIIHYLCYWFSTPYSTLYDFKAAMLNDYVMDPERPVYAGARIFRFADGTPFYDFTQCLAVSHSDQGEHVSAESRNRQYLRILFPEVEGNQPEFSRAEGTKYLMARREQEIEIYEMGQDGEERNHWVYNQRTHRAEAADPYDELIDLDEQPEEPAIQLQLPHALRNAIKSKNQQNPAGIPAAIVQTLREKYKCEEIPPIVLTTSGIRIFNATGRPITYEKEKENTNEIWKLCITDPEGQRRAVIVDDNKEGVYTEKDHLQLQCYDSEHDFVLITANQDKTRCWIRQPGKQSLSLYPNGEYLCAELRANRDILPKDNVPQQVLSAINRHHQGDLPVYRVATSQKDLHLFYAGTALKEIVQKPNGSLHINSTSGAFHDGDVMDETTKQALKFAVKGPDDHILIMDDGKGRFRVVQHGYADREITFSSMRGKPICGLYQEKLESKTNKATKAKT